MRWFGASRAVGALEREILRWVDEVWRIPERAAAISPQQGDPMSPEEKDAAAVAGAERLRRRWPEAELAELAAEMLFEPTRWQPAYLLPSPLTRTGHSCSDLRADMLPVPEPKERAAHRPIGLRRCAILQILKTCVRSLPPGELLPRLRTRLEEILADPLADREVPPRVPVLNWSEVWLPPNVDDCLELLLDLPSSPESLELVARIALGELDSGPYELPPSPYTGRIFRARAYGWHLQGRALRRWAPQMLQRLHDHSRLGYEAFRQAAEHLPDLVELASAVPSGDDRPNAFHRHVSRELALLAAEWCDRLAVEVAENLNERNCHVIEQVPKLHGGRFLIEAARHHAAYGLGRLIHRGDQGDLEEAIIHICFAVELGPDSSEDRPDLVAQLREYPEETLKALLPLCCSGRRVLCQALGWEAVIPLVDELAAVARLARMVDDHRYYDCDVRNDPDPALGVADPQPVRKAIRDAGEELCREVVELFRKAKMPVKKARRLIEAAAGWNRDWVEKGLPKREQTALKAYGLLPVERGQEEVLERYLFIRQFASETKTQGSLRQADEPGAVAVALTNLALNAGYADSMRLEWAMQARLSEGVDPLVRCWEIDEYQVRLEIGGGDAKARVRKGDRELKSVPKAVRESDAYPQVKNTIAQLRGQARRFRAVFEELMGTAETLSREDLEGLARLPVASAHLARLILWSEDGVSGLFEPDSLTLRTIGGTSEPLADEVRIAHPYDLLRAGVLSDWQRAVVRQRIVQPFKQAHREVYLLTPAEEETGSFTSRFAGHVLDAGTAARLFQARRWTLESGEEGTVPYKLFPQCGVQAFFEFPDAGHFLAETDIITSDHIWFAPYPTPPGSPGPFEEAGRLPLAEVPPTVFSEVMRDADLVVSVAQREGEGRISEEAYQRRGELLTALLGELGLPGVTIEGRHAHVQGKLARYRVHLGTAAIHIEPGAHLCVVPDRWGKRHPKLFLPFEGADDPKVSEVISKVLLLVNDDRIKDDSIVAQIAARG